MLSRYRERVARVSEPVARALLATHVRPNQLSCLGLLASALAAALLATEHGRLGGVFLALAGALDILDGALARVAAQESPFGAFLDSVLDRYSDILVLAGIVVLYGRTGQPLAAAVGLGALLGTVMVSYTRARAESVGVECRVGFMERGERLLLLIAGALLDLLLPAVWLVAVGANLTAVHRIGHVWQVTREPGAPTRRRG
jgi:CDP-diacylglycerol--glycerol-3-phosphate 3-phosphatidyltransferase